MSWARETRQTPRLVGLPAPRLVGLQKAPADWHWGAAGDNRAQALGDRLALGKVEQAWGRCGGCRVPREKGERELTQRLSRACWVPQLQRSWNKNWRCWTFASGGRACAHRALKVCVGAAVDPQEPGDSRHCEPAKLSRGWGWLCALVPLLGPARSLHFLQESGLVGRRLENR